MQSAYAKYTEEQLLRKLFAHSKMIGAIYAELERRDAVKVEDAS